jgi:hypothetical protein
MAYGKSMSRVIRDIYSYSSLVSRDFAGANFRATAKPPLSSFGLSISQGLEESQQLFLLSFAQIAESPDDMFGFPLVPLDGVLQGQ